ncbi:MAG: hypothetical protein RR893_00385 [Clostridia bacterium]
MMAIVIVAFVGVMGLGYFLMARIDRYLERGEGVPDGAFEAGFGAQKSITLAELNGRAGAVPGGERG